ncbi:hypothetical protein C0992_011586 [Termitomyces sp. T32_za158]|nr:hypothetical protein C0992_011586 [Termitomyces sp. T32_za158]
MSATNTNKKRVLIVGGGAAGMSAAFAFSQHPDLFDVVLYERSSSPGGMATSTSIDEEKYGADYINDGVQGASPVFYNTYAMFDKLGFSASDVGMQVSFGNDPENDFWSNVFPSQVIDKFGADIKKFGKVLKIIKATEPVFALISVSAMLRMFMFSKEFGEVIVFPLVALFFGTGNQTPFISCAILERVFMDPNMRLFEYSPDTFLASIPTMRAFPRLSDLYGAWKALVEKNGQGSVRIINEREVTRVKRFSCKEIGGVMVWSRPTKGTNNEQSVVDPGEEIQETFDELVICTDADAALALLGKDARWLEKRVLSNVKYLWDITVTHNDVDYMEKFDGVPPRGPKPTRVSDAKSNSLSRENISGDIPLEKHVFQTIFLDNSPESAYLWSKSEIDPKKIILEKWWKQQSHRWQHYAGTVPWMGLINGKVWLPLDYSQYFFFFHIEGLDLILVTDMHEIAVVSGLAAAYRLGAAYPFKEDEKCKRLFALCLAANHMMRLRKADRKGFFV